MAHWSGEVEPISPRYRYWSTNGEIHTIRRCASCDSERFYLRRPPGPFSGWHFECVACRTPRQLLQRDRWTLGILGPLTTQTEPQDRAVFAEINMEPRSCRWRCARKREVLSESRMREICLSGSSTAIDYLSSTRTATSSFSRGRARPNSRHSSRGTSDTRPRPSRIKKKNRSCGMPVGATSGRTTPSYGWWHRCCRETRLRRDR